jgi:trans-aconitate 2-methyltransferase
VSVIDFGDHRFTAPPERRQALLALLKRLLPGDRLLRILDLGCGTGAQLTDIAAAFPLAECIGVDVSEWNIQQALALSAASVCPARLHFHASDYLLFTDRPFDVILADSVLQNIPAPAEALAHKIGADLVPGGILIASLPYDCAFNRVLWTSRRVLRFLRGRTLERVAERTAALIHPGWPTGMIRERIPYLFLLPYRIDGREFRDVLWKAARLAVVEEQPVPHVSPAQPKHRTVIFRKQ